MRIQAGSPCLLPLLVFVQRLTRWVLYPVCSRGRGTLSLCLMPRSLVTKTQRLVFSSRLRGTYLHGRTDLLSFQKGSGVGSFRMQQRKGLVRMDGRPQQGCVTGTGRGVPDHSDVYFYEAQDG